MGESSTPRRPTHDTNTSRRKTSEHTHTHNINNNNTSSKQSKYKHTMKFTGLIASTLMLLLAVKASTASARSIAFPEPQYCCNAYTAECESCKAGVSVEEFCTADPTFPECPIEQPPICCNAYNAKCESCKEGLSEEEFCRIYPTVPECPTPTPVCCNAYNAECEACKFGITVEEMCRVHEEDMAFDSFLGPLDGCPQNEPKPCCRATLWSAKLVTPVSLRTNSAEEILTHMSALRSLPSHLILITATPRFGTPKSCMARWVPRSAAGTETGRASLSARRKHLILITATPRFGTRK